MAASSTPMLLRYSAVPHIIRWGIEFARNCTPERFRENAKANLHLALHSLKSLQEIGAETGISYDRATRGVLKIYRSKESLDAAQRSTDYLAQHGLLCERIDPDRCVDLEPALKDTKPTLAGALYFARDEVGDSNKFTQGLAADCAARGVQCRFGETVEKIETSGDRVRAVVTSKGRIAAARALLDAAMDPAYVDDAVEHLHRIEFQRVGQGSPNPDGRSVFFPVILRAEVRPGAPAPWETGVSTYYVRVCLVRGEPRIAEITEGP